MRSKIVIALLAAFFAALAAGFVRLQPPGSVTVFRNDNDLSVRTSRVYIRPLSPRNRCTVPTIDGALQFKKPVVAATATADEFPLLVRFSYTVPASVAAGWPGGDWCSSLRARVSTAAGEWAAGETADALLDDRRAAGDRAAAVLSTNLLKAGIVVSGMSARVDLPAGFERLRLVRDVATQARASKPVVFIGLDGGDWDLLDGYMKAGVMPALSAVVEQGAGGVLVTEQPPLSPLVWTTMMTGVSPLDHQILDFARFNPYTGTKEPITSDERRAPAIWNDLTFAGKQSAVFGLWATYAAEPVHGLNVSDRLFTFLYSERARPAGVVYPPTRQSAAEQELQRAESAITIDRLRGYIPSLSEAEYSQLLQNRNPYSEPAAALRRILVETEVYHRLARNYLDGRQQLPALTFVYLQGTDSIGHVFAPFAPPKQPEVSQQDFDRFSAVPEHYFRDIDQLIGEFSAIAERSGAVLLIASDHGFFWHDGRPTQISSTATATAAKWHRTEGIYVMRGRGIAAAPGHPLRGGVRQILPTLLALTGMPAGTGTPEPLAPIARAARQVDYGRFFQLAAQPPPPPSSSGGADEAIAKLKALGYIGSTESAKRSSGIQGTKTAGAFNNEGLILRGDGRIDDALRAFERAMTIDPNYPSPMVNESDTLFSASRDAARADALLVAALQHGYPDGVARIIGRAIACNRSGQRDRSLALLSSAIVVASGEPELRLFRGRFRMESRDCTGALADFQEAVRARPGDALAWASTGIAQSCLGDHGAARTSFERSLQLDPNQPQVRQMLRR